MAEAELLYRVRVEASQAVKDLEAAAGKVQNFSTQAANSSKGMSSMQQGVRNASFQLQDFVVQASNGTDAVRALGMQLPQLLMSFGTVGAVLGVAASLLPVVVSAVKGMGDASVKAANDLKNWTDEVEKLGKMGKEIESFAKAITGTAADGFKAYVEEYNKASKAQRSEMEAWLKLKLQVEQAKLNDLTSEAQGTNVDWGMSSGMPSGETQNQGPNAQRMVELGSQIRIQADNVKRLSAAVNGDFSTAMAGATNKADDFTKALTAVKAKHDELIQNQRLLKDAQTDYLQVFKQLTESEKAKLKLDEDIKNHVVQYTAAQQTKIRGMLDENIALEKQNLLQAEANKVVMESRTPLDAYNANIAKATYLHNEGYLSASQYNAALDKANKTIADSDPLISRMGSTMQTAFDDMAFAGKSLMDVFANMAMSIAKVAYQVMITEPLIRNLKNTMAQSGFFSSAPSGAGASSGLDNVSVADIQAGNFANGATFDGPVGGGSNVIPFARGGIVTQPKFFPMANGTGLVGEAGPEAIVPLKRGSDGKLGISGTGSTGGAQVNIYNQSGGEVETKERKDSNGMSVIDVYIKKAVADGFARGDFDKSMSTTYGIRRQGTR